MANVFNRTTPEYRVSVHTPDFDPADWAINPDVTAVAGQPVKYWFLTGATNAEGFEIVDIVDAATQAIIDAAEAAARLANEKDNAKTDFDAQRVLKALAELLVDEFNALRSLHALPPRTFAQLRTAIQAKIDAGT